MIFKPTFFVFFLCAAFIGAPLAQAQTEPQTEAPQENFPSSSLTRTQTVAPPISMPEDNSEVTILRDEYAGKYNLSSLQNLSQLYWRLGAFDFDDDVAVSNYIKINDCKIYTEYLNDDMEWKQIIGVMKDHLKKSSTGFPVNFQFVLQLHLGRYDPEAGGFPVVDKTGFTDVKRLQVDSMDHSKQICFDPKPVQDYPRSVTVILSKPFTLDFVKLDEHVAQAYILRKKSEFSKLDDATKLKSYERDAYLRLRITFSQYHGNLRAQNDDTMAILYGNIDGYEIFEDSLQKRLMLSVDTSAQQQGAMMSIPASPAVETAQQPVTATETTTTTYTVEEGVPENQTQKPATGMGFTTSP